MSTRWFPARAIQARRRRGRVVLGIAVLAAIFGVWASSRVHRGLKTPAPSKVLVDRRHQFLGEVPGADGELGYWPLPDVLPERIVLATLDTEDRRFFAHPGVSMSSVVRAIGQDVRNRRIVSGASTIAMQLARLQWPGQRTLSHKLREAFEALWLVHDAGHEAVLRQYLTLAPYGNRIHGAERAARMYFDRPLSDVSWLQAAFLAGLPQQPGRFSPWDEKGRVRALRRAERILRSMHAHGVIDAETLRSALKSELLLVPRPERDASAMHAVLAWSEAAEQRSGPMLQTSLDLDLQRKANALLGRRLRGLQDAGAGNAAAVIVDAVRGDVLAWVGSADFFDAEAHGAIDYVRVRRSPGSTLKPLIYGLAIDQRGFTAATPVADIPVEFATDDGKTFLPENASHGFLGPMLVRQALANSRNIPAIRALVAVTPDVLVKALRTTGAKLEQDAASNYGLGLALGAAPMSLEELTTLYLTLAGDGTVRPLRFFADDPITSGGRILRTDTAHLVANVLSDDDARRPTFVSGNPLEFPYAVAAKTGTSEGNRDAWTLEWSDRIVVGVWVGNHDWRQMNGVSGVSGAGQLAHDLMDLATSGRDRGRSVATTFAPPQGWEKRVVCPISGKLAGPHCPHRHAEWFAAGTEPVESCDAHHVVAIDVRNGLRAPPSCPDEFVTRKVMLDLAPDIASFLRRERIDVAPVQESPLCGGVVAGASIAVAEPRQHARYRWDPDTPPEASSVRFAATVTPPDEPVMWLVDDAPIAQVDYPYDARWSLTPGKHVVRAAFARLGVVSDPVEITVEN